MECWHTLSALAYRPSGAAQQECGNGGREKAGVKTNRRTNKAEIRIERWEGVPVYTAKEFWEIASLEGIVQELLHRTICEAAKMKATTTKPGRVR
jgi:hypothetical protein